MTDIKGSDREKNQRAGVSRNTNAQSVFDAYAHRPVVRSGYCESIMFYDGEAAAIGQDVAVVMTDGLLRMPPYFIRKHRIYTCSLS